MTKKEKKLTKKKHDQYPRVHLQAPLQRRHPRADREARPPRHHRAVLLRLRLVLAHRAQRLLPLPRRRQGRQGRRLHPPDSPHVMPLRPHPRDRRRPRCGRPRRCLPRREGQWRCRRLAVAVRLVAGCDRRLRARRRRRYRGVLLRAAPVVADHRQRGLQSRSGLGFRRHHVLCVERIKKKKNLKQTFFQIFVFLLKKPFFLSVFVTLEKKIIKKIKNKLLV